MSPAPAPLSLRRTASRRAPARLRTAAQAMIALVAATSLLGLGTAAAADAAPPALTASVLGEAPQGQGVFRFPQAVAVSAGGSRVYVGDQYSGVVQLFDGSGAWIRNIGGRAARGEPGRLGVVGGVAVDRSNHLYVLDAENDRVQIFDATSGAYLAGFGDPSMFNLMSGSPTAGAGIVASGLAVYQATPGAPIDLYVADSGNSRIARYRLDAATLLPTGPPALTPPSHGIQTPQGLTLNAAGTRLYVADDGKHRIVVLDPATLQIVALAGSLGGPPGSDPTGFFPYDVAVDNGTPSKLYVADNLNGRVQVFDATTLAYLTSFGRLAYGPGLGNLEIVRALHSDRDGAPGVAVADTANNRIQRFDASGNVTAAWGIAGRGFGYVSRPRGVAFTPAGGIAVADSFNHRVALYDPDGTQVDQRGSVPDTVGFAVPGPDPGMLEVPSSAVFTADGSLWVSDTVNRRVVRYAPDGTLAMVTQPGAVSDPRGLAPSPNGVYVASRGSDSVIEVRPDGATEVKRSGLADPIAVAFHPDGRAFVADDRRIRNVDTGQTIPAPNGGLWDHPAGLAFDAAGTLYVSEQRPDTPAGARVVRGTPNGPGYTWDTLATEGDGVGQVVEPAGLAVRPDGSTLLVADSGNNRVQRFDAPGTSPPALRRVNVAIDQPGRGTVVSDLPGIACVTDCTQGYGTGRTVTLVAQAKPGQVFKGWGGDCAAAGTTATCALAMSADHSVSASFAEVPVPPAPVVRASITSASIKPSTLHQARRASKRLGRKARKATRATVRVTLTNAARVELSVLQGRDGRRVSSTCRPPTRTTARRKRCTRYVALRGGRTFLPSSSVRVSFTPSWRGRPLPPGRYRLQAIAVDPDGTRSAPVSRAFTVLR